MAVLWSNKTRIFYGVVLALVLTVLMPVSAFASEITDSNADEPTTVVVVDETVSTGNIEEIDEAEDESITYEVVTNDYTEQLETAVYLLEYITGILVFFVIIVLCKYVYSFFNIFF